MAKKRSPKTPVAKPVVGPRKHDDESCLLDDVARKQRYMRGPKSIVDALGQVMAKRGFMQTQAPQKQAEVWAQAAGEAMAKHTRATNVSRGSLHVLVRNSVVLMELSLRRGELLGKVQAAAPEMKIRDIKFKVGAVEG